MHAVFCRMAESGACAGELVKAVEELRRVGQSEVVRRQELEAALRESAAIFKRELYEKNEELVALQAELGWVLPAV